MESFCTLRKSIFYGIALSSSLPPKIQEIWGSTQKALFPDLSVFTPIVEYAPGSDRSDPLAPYPRARAQPSLEPRLTSTDGHNERDVFAKKKNGATRSNRETALVKVQKIRVDLPESCVATAKRGRLC